MNYSSLVLTPCLEVLPVLMLLPLKQLTNFETFREPSGVGWWGNTICHKAFICTSDFFILAVYLKPTFDREEVKTEKLSEHTKELLVVQNSMVRVILGLKQADHINMKEVRKQINMLSVNQMSVYHTAMEAYNIINRTSSEQLQGKLSRHDGKHSERNNANNELYVPKKPLVKCTGFSYLGPKLYNMLTTEVKNAKSIDDFKNKLMGWIWKNIH